MQASEIIQPLAISQPVAVSGIKNTIPENATGSNLASIQEGFPQKTMISPQDGGEPPYGQDFNGLFYLSTDQRVYTQNGGIITFNQDVSDAIGGYPQGAILDYYVSSTQSFSKVVSLIDNNTNNFVTTTSYIDGVNWELLNFGGANIDLSNITTTAYDNINQTKALETGDISTNSIVYSDILNYAHSTFDKSKFTVVGTPTITDDGIASGFSLSNYLKINYTDFVDNDFEFTIEFTLNSNALQGIFQSKIGGNAVGFRVWVEANLLYTSLFGNGQQVWYSFITSALTDTKYTYTLKKSGNIYTEELVYGDKKATKSHTSDVVMDIDTNGMYLGRDFQKPLLGVVDLKSFTIWSNGQPVFNGNITGTDTYTINEEETQIPYTLSKTGSKIVDVYYRELIQGLYQEQGYAPYYTIDEQNQNFTLPMGEVYGMIERKLDAKKTPHVIETYNDGQNWYRIWSDGWIEQGGYIGQITSGTLTFLQPFTNTNYSVLCTPRDVSSPPRVTVWNNATVANIQYSTTVQSGQSIGAGYTSSSWYAFGY